MVNLTPTGDDAHLPGAYGDAGGAAERTSGRPLPEEEP